MSKLDLVVRELPEPDVKGLSGKSAGHNLTNRVLVMTQSATVVDALRLLEKRISKIASINYVYVVNSKGELVGVVSIKDLFRRSHHVPLKEIMKTKVVVVHTHTPLTRTVSLALEHNIKSLPVIDKNNNFLGIVTSDTILNALYKQFQSNILGLAGINASFDNVLKLKTTKIVKHRLPWLVLGLLGGFLVAQIVGLYDATLEEHIILATFIPLMLYVGGASSTQMTAFYIRDSALDAHIISKRYFLKHFSIITALALILATLFFVLSYLFYSDLSIATTLGIALLGIVISSFVSGLLMPHILSKFKFDAANASGPVVTIMQDFFGIIVYLTVASFFF